MKSSAMTVMLCSLIALTLLQRASGAEPTNQEEAVVSSGVGNNTYGTFNTNEKFLYEVGVDEEWSSSRFTKEISRTKIVFQFNRIEIIMYHESTDVAAEYDIYGGIDQNWVNIKFKNRRFHGIYYTVKIYGVPVENALTPVQTAEPTNQEEAVVSGGVGNNTYGTSNAIETLLYEDGVEVEWTGDPVTSEIMRTAEKGFQFNRIEFILHESTDKPAKYDIYGGVGQNWVNITFKSKPFNSIDYTVKIYGVPVENALTSLQRIAVVSGGVGTNEYGYYETNEECAVEKRFQYGWIHSTTGKSFYFKYNNFRLIRIEMIMHHKSRAVAAKYDIYHGIHQEWSVIRFKSKPFRGIDYTVKICGV